MKFEINILDPEIQEKTDKEKEHKQKLIEQYKKYQEALQLEIIEIDLNK